MQWYKYIQYIQFNYLQDMSINCKKLFVYSYCYPVFLDAYIIAWKLLTFSTKVVIIISETLRCQQNLCELTGVLEI